jgi:hypothetical protein
MITKLCSIQSFICFLWIPYQLQIISYYSIIYLLSLNSLTVTNYLISYKLFIILLINLPVLCLVPCSVFVWGPPGLLATEPFCWVVLGLRSLNAAFSWWSCLSHTLGSSLVILLWLMLPRDHFVSRFLYFTTAGVKCCVAAATSCPVLHFSVVIFFWSFGIIDTSTIKCWELSTAQVGARGREGCCTYSLSFIYRLYQMW